MRTRVEVAGGQRVIAIDGKTARGARAAGNLAPHLVAALDHHLGVVLAQVQVAAKSNEIPALRTLLEAFDLVSAVVTADAMHAQKDTATYITSRGGHYVFTVKANQPGLFARCKKLPWTKIRDTSSVQTGHGRRVRRTIKVAAAPAVPPLRLDQDRRRHPQEGQPPNHIRRVALGPGFGTRSRPSQQWCSRRHT